jgi:rhomboid protease GluP
MPGNVRICPFCGKLNAREDSRCVRCNRRLPSAGEALLRDNVRRFLGDEYPLTKVFIAVSVIVYLGMMLGAGSLSLFSPPSRLEALRWGVLDGANSRSEPWRYLSAMFVHFGLLHVGLNCLGLQSLGRSTESVLGSLRFGIVFLGSGILGFVASDIVYAHPPITGGISGGVFGLLGVAAGWRYADGDPEWKRLALTGFGYAAVMWLMPGFSVNNAAHLGGLVAGGLLGWVFYRERAERRFRTLVNVIGIALLCAIPSSIVLSQLSTTARVRGDFMSR